MTQRKCLLAIATLLCFTIPIFNSYADEVVAVGDYGYLICSIEDLGEGFTRGTLYSLSDGEYDVRFGNKRKIRRAIRRTRRQIRVADRNGEDSTLLSQQLSDLIVAKGIFKQCRRGELGSGGGSGDDDDDDSGNGGGGSGGGSNSSDVCAVATGNFTVSSSSVRIINGTKCSVTANTPTVSLSLNGGECTGTVIATNAVLTAAHCTTGASSATVTTGNGTFQSVSVLTHPNYDENATPAAKQDMGLVILGQDMGITPAKIYGGTSFTAGEEAINAGYGLVNPQQDLTDGLQAVKVNIVSSDAEQVTSLYQPSQNLPGIGTNCPGDSGGPLYVVRSNEFMVGAVVSNGTDQNCGTTGNDDEANFTLTGNATNKAFILQHVPSATFVDQ